jgi:hypothetical protein
MAINGPVLGPRHSDGAQLNSCAERHPGGNGYDKPADNGPPALSNWYFGPTAAAFGSCTSGIETKGRSPVFPGCRRVPRAL